MSDLVDSLATRDPAASKVPNGAVTDIPIEVPLNIGWLPTIFSARLVNAGEISAATGAIPTNDSPTFAIGFERSVAESASNLWDQTVAAGKKISGGVGSIVTGLFPWWFWALLGLALVGWIVFALAPVLATKRA